MIPTPRQFRAGHARTRGRRSFTADLNRLLWGVPIVVGAALIVFGPHYGDRLLVTGIGAGLGAGALILAARHPATTTMVLVGALPFSNSALAFLYKTGLPAAFFSPLRSWKELLAAGVIVAGIRARRQRVDGSDVLEVVVGAYVAVVAAYVLVPQLALKPIVHPFSERVVAGRNLTTFVVLFLGAYWCRFSGEQVRRIAGVALTAGVVVAGIGIYESVDPDGWDRFAVDTLGIREFEREVLGVFSPQPNSVIAAGRVTRVGSVYYSAIIAGFGLVLPLAIGVERLVRFRATASTGLRAAAVGLCLLLTQTRSAISAGLVAILASTRPWPGRSQKARVRLSLLLVAAAVAMAPTVVSSGLSERVTSAIEGSDRSTDTHFERSREGIRAVTMNPLGFGVGRNPRPAEYGGSITDSHLIPENYYLQVGLEVGVLGMFLFAAITLVTISRLIRRARQRPSPEASAVAAGLSGLAVGALLLQTWSSIHVSWMVWSVVGAALGQTDTSSADRESEQEHAAGHATMAP